MNELKHIAEFRSVLTDYHLSDSAKQNLQETRLVLLVGPSSSGRNTIINELLKTDKYHYIISDTTRQPRVNNGQLEQNGREYWFRTEEDLLRDLQRGEFLEAAIIHNQQVSGNSVREVEKAHQAHKIAINEVEIDGADNIHKIKPDTTIIFVTPPSFAVWMARFQRRGALPADEIRRRVESAREEFATALKHDYYTFVVNDTLEQAVADIDVLATTGKPDIAKHQAARNVVQQLLVDIQEYLDRSQA
jgi:guanylate kinase